MTATQKAKQQIKELQEILELIEYFEQEKNLYISTIEYAKVEMIDCPSHIYTSLKESTELLNHNIDRWNELTNTKLTKVTE